jgi:hypothetical protein
MTALLIGGVLAATAAVIARHLRRRRTTVDL